MKKFPSAREIVEEAQKYKPRDINDLHSKAYFFMRKYKENYYKQKVDAFLRPLNLEKSLQSKLRREMLRPIKIGNKIYSNFMEEASRRISQTFQVISGNIAELCVEKTLNDIGLKENVDYLRKKDESDFVFYHPNIKKHVARHRLEVKNVKLRERGVRGLAFDGDSMIGFFDDPGEFTEYVVRVIEQHCVKTGGYCYLPPQTLLKIKQKHKVLRFKSNLETANDMKHFVKNGIIT